MASLSEMVFPSFNRKGTKERDETGLGQREQCENNTTFGGNDDN